ncbi:uncharacterized protein LOC131156022 [Malania oleifera]|uniref:uncharacterized protein LOC131156022 n=1 Tax=Malania oleifera TaxID=397392 RepID=UPI0025AE1EE3|nr:uncharacterized protein LOC131156022 [Malania oleifera]
MVISWLLNSISKDISSSIIYCESASVIWADLKEQYSQVNGPPLYKLKQNISNHVQGSLSVTLYFAKLKGLRDELAEIQSPHICTCSTCTCGACKNNLAQQESDNMLTFLMGLNESYGVTCGHILLMDPLPIVSHTYALVMQEERHCNISTPPSIEGIALATSNYPPQKDSRLGPPKRSLKCNHGGKDGHTIDRYYRIHGFPPGSCNSKPVTSSKHSANQVSSTTSSFPFTPK